MIRRVTCDNAERFDICWMSLYLGRPLLIADAEGKQTPEGRRLDRDLVRKLREASNDAPVEADVLQTGDRQRDVRLGATIDFSQPELDRLIAIVNRPCWNTNKLEVVEDTVDWLAAAERI